MNANPQRIPLIDTLKVLASQIIVLHHMVSYGPLSRVAHRHFPDISEWLFDYGRMAVQAFIVISGFLSAKLLATATPAGTATVSHPLHLLWRRYERLVLPFLAALAIGIGCAAVARSVIGDDWVPDRPTFAQFFAHAFLLQGLLGFDSLLAGAWYVAIDFQLFALMMGILWLSSHPDGRRNHSRFIAIVLVVLLAVASLFYFNCDEAWDNWGLYFFGSYAMGACAYWASNKERSVTWLVLLGLVVALALLEEFRLRIGIALIIALALGLERRMGLFEKLPPLRMVSYLGRISYSMFLIHFAICLLANAALMHFIPDAEPGIGWILGTWASCIVAGAVLFHSVENRIGLVSLQGPLWRRLTSNLLGRYS